MALLQISEPGESLVPHQRKRAVGIDLGTTNSLVAAVRNSVAEVLPDLKGNKILPSIVRYLNDSVEVGLPAQSHISSDAENTIVSVKRLMGRGVSDLAEAEQHIAQTILSDESALPQIKTDFAKVSAIEVSAEILNALKLRAEKTLGGDLAGAVVTVPAYFDDAQRHATKEAAKLAGLPVLRLLNEPTAAAIAYGLDKSNEGVVVVYDFGGGTFDISILQLRKGIFEVLATAGDTALGGDDIDRLIMQCLVEKAGVSLPVKASMSRRLMVAAKQLKERLTENTTATVDIELEDGTLQQASMALEEFEGLVSGLLDKTLLPCRRALADANLLKSDIDEVVMVGGSTRIPLVRQKVSEFFGRQVLTDINPDEVVAVGAALQADILIGNKSAEDMLLLDVIPLSLGLETMGGLVEKIIPRNSTIPVARAQNFTTFKDGQTALSVHVVQGERELVSDCRSLAKFELRGIPPMVAGAAKIEVVFQVDADGLLNVSARELSSGVEASVTVKPSFGLSDDEIETMLNDSTAHAKQDAQTRVLAEQQLEAKRVIEALDAALADDGDELLSDQEKASILSCREQLVSVSMQSDVGRIKDALSALESETQGYVERRMNVNIRKAMSGHSVDEYNQ